MLQAIGQLISGLYEWSASLDADYGNKDADPPSLPANIPPSLPAAEIHPTLSQEYLRGYVGHECVYLMQLTATVYKVGRTRRIVARMKEHHKGFGRYAGCDARPIAVWSCDTRAVATSAEKKIKRHIRSVYTTPAEYEKHQEVFGAQDIYPVIAAMNAIIAEENERAPAAEIPQLEVSNDELPQDAVPDDESHQSDDHQTPSHIADDIEVSLQYIRLYPADGVPLGQYSRRYAEWMKSMGEDKLSTSQFKALVRQEGYCRSKIDDVLVWTMSA